jgi:2-polyprenyl-3-methyl-5-hydroxy-6-metoxy-1,4-benzoquinol methylase
MSTTVAEQHNAEVKRGQRFQFGKNWARFLKTVNEDKIAHAERSLQVALSSARLEGKTFLDIGSGSGLFSLAARRLGASVYSFDYDTNSVACTMELKRRFFAADRAWRIEQGSVLDRAYLGTLGTFNIVYSWGVLHHTGQMWTALDNVKSLVKQTGQLYIAIYNELGPVTDRWRLIKRTYNALPKPLRLPFALSIIASSEARSLALYLRTRSPRDYVRQWTRYEVRSRGMNKWHDWIDWIGGYPYETATLEDLIDFFGKDGFAVEWLEPRVFGYGCNEIVFRRQAAVGYISERYEDRGVHR